MGITTAFCTSCKVELMEGEVDFSSDTSQTFKMALYTSSADLDASTAAYTTDNEVVGTGYVAGGIELTISQNPTALGTTAVIDFDNPTWSNATITARGAMIYRTSAGNPSVAVYDFGENKSTTAADFTVNIPAVTATTAVIRVA